MKVAVNSGPLMALAKLSLIHLLVRLYDSALVPSAVYDEVVTRGIELAQADAYAVQLAVMREELKIVQVPARMGEEVETLPLGAGEKQAIHVALTEAVDYVLLDDLLAREAAQRLGLRVTGTLGVLAKASREGFLNRQERDLVFQAILDREDIWISQALVRRVWDELRRDEQ
ncbi:MAG: hypothetical protein U0768_12640 [Anaerolineae bacterium]